MIGVDGSSFFRLRVSGIHAGCGWKYVSRTSSRMDRCDADKSPLAAGGHYNITRRTASAACHRHNKTEVWLDFKVNSDGKRAVNSEGGIRPEAGDAVNCDPR